MELVVSSLDNDEDNSIASKDVSEHLVLSQRTAISIPYFRPTKDKAFKKLLRIHRHKCKEESIEVGPEFFSDAPKKRHSIRFSIAKAQQEVGGKIKKVVGSVRNSGESKRGKLSSIPILLEDLEEGKQSRFEDGTKLTAAYSNLSSLGLITSRASSTSSLSSFDSTTVPATPDSAPTTPAASLYSSPFNFPNPTPFSSPIAGPISPKTTLLPSFPTDFTPPSRTLTLDGIPTPRKESRVGFNTSKKLSIKTKDFQKMIRSRKKKSGVKLDVDDDAILANALVEIGIAVQEEEKVVMDVLIEHQRGAVVFGLPKFSANVLNQFDPTAWVDGNLNSSPFTPFNHPLPNPFWRWTHSEWLVDMSKDVDEQGWTYSTRFRSMFWHAEPDTWRSFVRRRKWVRNRIFTPKRLNLNSIGSPMVKKSEIDWESLRPLPNTVFNLEDVIGMKKALSLLPISSQRKDDIYSANNDDIRDPFLSWSMIRLEGESIFSRNRPNRARESTPVEEESWKVAVIEINYQRVRKVLKSCRLDREKLGIWNWWLGFEVNCPLFLERLDAEEEDKTAEEREKDDIGQRHLELLALSGKKRNEIGKRPSLDDVWDLLEFRLDAILGLFEFEFTRLTLVRLLLKLHPTTHSAHSHTDSGSDQPFPTKSFKTSGITPRLGFFQDILELERFYSIGIEK